MLLHVCDFAVLDVLRMLCSSDSSKQRTQPCICDAGCCVLSGPLTYLEELACQLRSRHPGILGACLHCMMHCTLQPIVA
jgi:hypothetical protein